jgi:hypothetical protein
MGEYWSRVIARAWADTVRSFKWNQQTVVAILIALGGLVPLWLTVGFPAASEHLISYLWYALPITFAAILLFAWNFVAAQADTYRELAATTESRILALESELARHTNRLLPPNYEAIRSRQEFQLLEAACLWCNLAPQPSAPTADVRQWVAALEDALVRGELEHVPRRGDRFTTEHRGERTLLVSDFTVVTRRSLLAFAKQQGEIPRFLNVD